ncbi:hypothetical protein K2Z84_29525 [Candidatus Binatia bacterium]|jgi:hypothetical protein|nr:hypothetical protein [Candidatus Binatia bacterium]
MDLWIWISLGVVAVAIALPLVMRSFGGRDPEKVAAEQREQEEVVAEATEALQGMLQTLREGGKVPTGPGTPVHDRIAALRPRMRKHFTLSATSEFDREIGFELNRPGLLALAAGTVEARVDRALRALRHTMAR